MIYDIRFNNHYTQVDIILHSSDFIKKHMLIYIIQILA